jgi:hypothetical protein
MLTRLSGLVLGLVFLLSAGLVFSAETSVFGEDLTPYGAERNGAEEGAIPAWDGGTAKNYTQYADQLSQGQKALLLAYPDTYKLPIYPSHRTASAPQWVYDNIASNFKSAQLVNDGNGIQKAIGGIPFPVPKNAAGEYDPLKILWNHLTRWRGMYVKAEVSEAPVHTNGSYSLITAEQQAFFTYYDPRKTIDTLDNKLSYFLAFIKKPSRLAGGAVLVHETIDRLAEPRSAWAYSSGTRRVRRAPSIEYDMPIPSADNLITSDDVDMFNGALDRFNWSFVGKKALYIPYNNFDLSNATADHETLLRKGHVNPDKTRYELHRVWIVEGTLKADIRHLYKKRRFYIDEDSWSIVQADQYDARDELWRVHLSYLVNYYHVPVTWSALTASYDLQSKRYFAGFLDNSNGMAIQFIDKPPTETLFSPQSLRRMGR